MAGRCFPLQVIEQFGVERQAQAALHVAQRESITVTSGELASRDAGAVVARRIGPGRVRGEDAATRAASRVLEGAQHGCSAAASPKVRGDMHAEAGGAPVVSQRQGEPPAGTTSPSKRAR